MERTSPIAGPARELLVAPVLGHPGVDVLAQLQAQAQGQRRKQQNASLLPSHTNNQQVVTPAATAHQQTCGAMLAVKLSVPTPGPTKADCRHRLLCCVTQVTIHCAARRHAAGAAAAAAAGAHVLDAVLLGWVVLVQGQHGVDLGQDGALQHTQSRHVQVVLTCWVDLPASAPERATSKAHRCVRTPPGKQTQRNVFSCSPLSPSPPCKLPRAPRPRQSPGRPALGQH